MCMGLQCGDLRRLSVLVRSLLLGLDVKACVITTFNMVSLILVRRTRLVAWEGWCLQ